MSNDLAKGKKDLAKGEKYEAEGDYAQAMLCYRRAAEAGDADAALRIGILYNTGRGVEKNDEERNRWYQIAADRGQAHAMYILGSWYEYGGKEGYPLDYAKAAALYAPTAAKGSANAQYHLGKLYARGDGVKKDLQKALILFYAAAQQGHELAAARLAEME